jgi:2-polyprenyl-6-methoxyphenol hydroxylase-like FAD-dependent oxidoreductase
MPGDQQRRWSMASFWPRNSPVRHRRMDALARYDKWRRPLARRVQKSAAMLQRLCGMEQASAVRVRDGLLAGLAHFPRLSEEVIRRALAADVRTVTSAFLPGDAR